MTTSAQHSCSHIIGSSQEITAVRRTIQQISAFYVNVFLSGEEGTGKELVAESIHRFSNRKEKPFVSFSASLVPKNQMAVELFGRVPSTQDEESKKGIIEEAYGGTLFIDDIEFVPHEIQGQLLQMLDTASIVPEGAFKKRSVNVRLIVAARQNADVLLKSGVLRQDLYYRLNAIQLSLPPLRDRLSDIPLLVKHFLHSWNEECDQQKNMSDECIDCLLQHQWFGNVRELSDVVMKSCLLSQGNVIGIADLPQELRRHQSAAEIRSSKKQLKSLEENLLKQALRTSGYNPKEAASKLNMSLSTFYRKLKLYNIPTKLHE